jgi:hypothetical protein
LPLLQTCNRFHALPRVGCNCQYPRKRPSLGLDSQPYISSALSTLCTVLSSFAHAHFPSVCACRHSRALRDSAWHLQRPAAPQQAEHVAAHLSCRYRSVSSQRPILPRSHLPITSPTQLPHGVSSALTRAPLLWCLTWLHVLGPCHNTGCMHAMPFAMRSSWKSTCVAAMAMGSAVGRRTPSLIWCPANAEDDSEESSLFNVH